MATITGTDNDDNILGTPDEDTITGGLGWDTIQGGAGNDSIQGGEGNDWLSGGAGDDTVDGGEGDDDLYMGSGDGNDTLIGGAGNDRFAVWPLGPQGTQYVQVDGGDGDDEITVSISMGWVADNAVTATGGAGQDTYRFLSGDGAWGLTITDFEVGADGDRIELWSLLEYSGSRGFQGGNPFATGNAFLRLVQNGADTLLQYDQDGAGGFLYGWHTAATLRNVDASTLTAENFLGVAPDGSPVPGKVVDGTAAPDYLQGGFFDDTIRGGAGPDSLYGNGGNDWIEGGDEEGWGDYIEGGAGHDTIYGGAGNDTLRGDRGNDYVDGGDGNDYLVVLPGGGDDTLVGGGGNDIIDVVPLGFNGAQHVVVQGGDGDDDIRVGALVDGQETVLATGGAGADIYRFSMGDRARGLTITDFEEGADGDRFDLEALLDHSSQQGRGYEGGNPFSAEQGFVRLVQQGEDTLLQYDEDGAAGAAYTWHTAAVLQGVDASALTIDNFVAFSPDGAPVAGQVVEGTDGNDQLVGWWGDDTIRGGMGNDVLDGQTGADWIEGGDGADHLLGYIGNDTLLGGAGNDMLEGEVGHDSLDGGDGNDTLVAGGGGNDTLVGGAGADQFQIWMQSGEQASVRANGGTGDDYFQISNTSAGTLTATGGAGRDTYFFVYGALSKGVTVTDFSTGAGGDLLDLSRLLEHSVNYWGFQGGSPLSAANGYLRFVQSGKDTLLQQDEDGAAGSIYGWHTVMRLKGVTAGDITPDNFIALNRTTQPWSQRLLGGLGHDTLTGAAGDDTLDGGWGFDAMAGGAGDDVYGVDSARDIVTERADEGTDTVRTSVDWKLAANFENLVLEAGAKRGTGNGAANVITGNAAANVLDGGKGRDTLAGGGGNDEYRVDVAGDTVVEKAGGGADLVVSTAASYTLAANVENGRIAAAGKANLTGNALANVLVGGDGANRLVGAGGNDVLAGGGGKDVLVGGAGRDVFDFDAVTDSTVAAKGRDTITDFKSGRQGDRIDLSGIDANDRTAADDAFTFIGSRAFSANATGQLRYEYDSAKGVGILYGSTDADRAAEFAIELTGVPALAAGDLVL